jgi:hypothetical protein
MKQLTLRLVLPLTIILFATVTKWWHVEIDGPDIILYGFPWPYRGPGLHTSVSTQYFLAELFIDLIFYFCILWLLIFCLNRFSKKIIPGRKLAFLMYTIAALFVAFSVLWAAMPENLWYLYRDFPVKPVETGIHIITNDRSDFPY